MLKLKSLYLTICLVLFFVLPSFAALTLDQQAVVDQTTGQITDYVAMAWVLVLAITGGLFGITLFKKFFSRGAR